MPRAGPRKLASPLSPRLCLRRACVRRADVPRHPPGGRVAWRWQAEQAEQAEQRAELAPMLA